VADTVVFIPALNEEEALPAVLDELGAVLPQADVFVVDDGSNDRTADVAREHGAHVLSFGENRGLKAAIAAGYAYAATHGFMYAGRVDGDGQHPVAELAKLLDLVRRGEADVAIGSRFLTDASYEALRYRPTRTRRVGTAVLRRAMRPALGRPFTDATSGMYAVNAAAMPVLAGPYESGAPEVEALLRLREAGLRVAEIPVHMRERTSGRSKLRGRRALVLVLTVAAVLAPYVLRRRR
jgi:GT2 family glycosyltransferase